MDEPLNGPEDSRNLGSRRRPRRIHPPPRLRAGLLTISDGLAGVINFGFSIALTHKLKEGQFADFAGGQAILLVVGTFASAAMPWVLARELVRAGDVVQRRRAVVTVIFLVNAAGGLVAGALTGVISSLFAPWPIPGVVALATLFIATGSTASGYLQATRPNLLAGLSLLEFVVKAASGAVLVFVVNEGATGALLGSVIAAGGFSIVGVFIMRRDLGVRHLTVIHELWEGAKHIGSLQVICALIGSSDSIVVVALATTRLGAGQYQAASTLGRIPLFVSIAVSTAAFPILAAGSDSLTVRLESLRAYLLVACFGWLVLATAPARVIGAAFPADFVGLRTWLPYTAALGVAIGLINLVTTFAQSEEKSDSGLRRLSVGALTYVGALVVGGEVDGVRGLAVGAVLASWFCVVLLIGITSERTSLLELLRRILRLRFVAIAVPVAAALITIRQPVIWLALAAVGIIGVLLVAFPELVPTSLRRASE
jgi:O-antigen/teichoic acid export membrane protein